MPEARPRELEGYPLRLWAPAGEPRAFCLRSPHPENVLVVERYAGPGLFVGDDPQFEEVARLPFGLAEQPVPHDAPAAGCGWTPTVTARTAGWRQGTYRAHVWAPGASAEAVRQSAVTFLVGPAAPGARVAVLAPVSTWLAYNPWGGQSLYHNERGPETTTFASAHRPNPALGWEPTGAIHAMRAEAPAHDWLDGRGRSRPLPGLDARAPAPARVVRRARAGLPLRVRLGRHARRARPARRRRPAAPRAGRQPALLAGPLAARPGGHRVPEGRVGVRGRRARRALAEPRPARGRAAGRPLYGAGDGDVRAVPRSGRRPLALRRPRRRGRRPVRARRDDAAPDLRRRDRQADLGLGARHPGRSRAASTAPTPPTASRPSGARATRRGTARPAARSRSRRSPTGTPCSQPGPSTARPGWAWTRSLPASSASSSGGTSRLAVRSASRPDRGVTGRSRTRPRPGRGSAPPPPARRPAGRAASGRTGRRRAGA